MSLHICSFFLSFLIFKVPFGSFFFIQIKWIIYAHKIKESFSQDSLFFSHLLCLTTTRVINFVRNFKAEVANIISSLRSIEAIPLLFSFSIPLCSSCLLLSWILSVNLEICFSLLSILMEEKLTLAREKPSPLNAESQLIAVNTMNSFSEIIILK